jgi:hypothetical protein
MTRIQLYNLFCKYYEYLYCKVLHYNDFKFKPSIAQISSIGVFIDILDRKLSIQSIGEEWIFNYMVYSFRIRSEQNTRFGNKIYMNWILGKKAYELYEKNRGENWLYFNRKFIEQYNISFLNLNPLEEVKTIKNDDLLVEFDEELRRRYHDSDFPLSLCLNTVIFRKESQYCQKCICNIDCEILNK